MNHLITGGGHGSVMFAVWLGCPGQPTTAPRNSPVVRSVRIRQISTLFYGLGCMNLLMTTDGEVTAVLGVKPSKPATR